MELLVVMGLGLGLPALAFLVGGFLPVQRWSFVHEGRSYEVVNYLFREAVLVDGVRVKDTRVGGNSLTEVVHGIALPSGEQLNIRLWTANGVSAECTATVGGEEIFTSAPQIGVARAVLPQIAGAGAPGPTTKPTERATPTDERWAPAQVLLGELAADAELTASVELLRTALSDAFDGLARAEAAEDAHRALGGDDGSLDAVLATREQSVGEVLGLLRDLHLAAAAREDRPIAPPDVEAVLGRLEAEREVRDHALREAASRRRERS